MENKKLKQQLLTICLLVVYIMILTWIINIFVLIGTICMTILLILLVS